MIGHSAPSPPLSFTNNIGGAFLALPAVTTPLGYIPAALGLFVAWTFLVGSSFAFIEAAGLVSDAKQSETKEEKKEGESGLTTVATIIQYAFGEKYASVGSFLFISQMFAVTTGQIVKGAELLSDFTPVPYLLACLLPPAIIGYSTFTSEPSVVERINTLLTVCMVGGFAALIVGAVQSGNHFCVIINTL
mmetsp:Transcript_31852/g.48374  ORF Transcript_31852/g.48374 Transcript_31852/m.48374 type:complete len:190 (-) Transcript_31852:235-804(-)